jgi:hypothetical protein
MLLITSLDEDHSATQGHTSTSSYNYEWNCAYAYMLALAHNGSEPRGKFFNNVEQYILNDVYFKYFTVKKREERGGGRTNEKDAKEIRGKRWTNIKSINYI